MSRVPHLLALSCSLFIPVAASAEELWIGIAPFCAAKPERCAARGMAYVRSDARGDKKACVTGVKVLCRDFPENPNACTKLVGKVAESPRRDDSYTFVADNSTAISAFEEVGGIVAPGPARAAFVECVRACKATYDADLSKAKKEKRDAADAIYNAYVLCSGRRSLTPPR